MNTIDAKETAEIIFIIILVVINLFFMYIIADLKEARREQKLGKSNAKSPLAHIIISKFHNFKIRRRKTEPPVASFEESMITVRRMALLRAMSNEIEKRLSHR